MKKRAGWKIIWGCQAALLASVVAYAEGLPDPMVAVRVLAPALEVASDYYWPPEPPYEIPEFGALELDQNYLSNRMQGQPRFTFAYLGYVPIDYTVSATVSGGMSLGTSLGDTGPDRFVLAAIFTAPLTYADECMIPDYCHDLEISDFSDDDVLGVVPIRASATCLARPGELVMFLGCGVTPSSNFRNLRFLLQTPTEDTTAGAEQVITITIGVIVL